MTRRVRLLFDIRGWAYYYRCVALQKYAPEDFEVTIGPDYGRAFKRDRHDLVLQLCYSCTRNVKVHVKKGGYNMRIVAGINVAAKAAKPWLKANQKYADWVVLNSQMAWEKLGQPEKTSYISNGVDREVFRVDTPIENRKPRVLWCGSKFHRKNKGYDSILRPLKDRLAKRGIACDLHLVDSHGRRRNQDQMAAWYQSGTIYVCASQSEGTPNPALEAASCGAVVVSTRVGNMPELIEDGVNGFLVERDQNAIHDAVLKAVDRYPEMSAAMQERIASWHWRERSRQYYDLFRRLINGAT